LRHLKASDAASSPAPKPFTGASRETSTSWPCQQLLTPARESGPRGRFQESQAAVISSPEMSLQNTWHIIPLGSFVFNCIAKREGAGGRKRLLTSAQEDEIRY